MQDQICIGRDFRDQNDTEKLHETNFPGASKEGLNPSNVSGIAYAARANERQNISMQREGSAGGGWGATSHFGAYVGKMSEQNKKHRLARSARDGARPKRSTL